MTVVVIGDLVTDVLATLGDSVAVGSDTTATIRETGGGSAANTACWLGALDVPTTLVAVVGDDAAGIARIGELTCRSAVRVAPGARTGTVIVLSTPDERTMITDRGANGLLRVEDVDAALDGAEHLHLSGYTLFDPATAEAGRYALTAARAAGITTSVDAGSARPLQRLGPARFMEWIKGTDLLFANLDEARVLTGSDFTPEDPEANARHLATNVTNAIVKLGSGGAVWAGSQISRTAAEVVDVVDPTGAGDAFAAGLLAAWIAGATPERALAAGATTGARAVTMRGARPTV